LEKRLTAAAYAASVFGITQFARDVVFPVASNLIK
jgi:hypothetical protein